MKAILKFGHDETEDLQRALKATTLCSILHCIDGQIRTYLEYPPMGAFTEEGVTRLLERIQEDIKEADLNNIYT